MALNFVLLFMLNAQNEVLMLRRINTPFCNQCYALPGGEIRPGENALKTAVREAKNSLNIDINSHDLEFVHIMHRKCNASEFFACIFRPKSYHGTIANHEPLRHDDLQWFAINDLPTNIVPAHQYAITQIINGRAYSEHGWLDF